MSKKTTTFRYGDNVKPNRVSFSTRDNGKVDTYYSQKGDKSHGHSVRRADGSVEYSRTQKGRRV